MFSLSPTFAKRAAIAPIVNRETPRNLSALPPSVRSLPVDLQVIVLCDMLVDARQELERTRSILNRVYAERDALEDALSR